MTHQKSIKRILRENTNLCFKVDELHPQTLLVHTCTHMNILQLKTVCLRHVEVPYSVIWFNHTLLDDLSQVRVFHGGCHSFFIINLLINCRYKQQFSSVS